MREWVCPLNPILSVVIIAATVADMADERDGVRQGVAAEGETRVAKRMTAESAETQRKNTGGQRCLRMKDYIAS